MTVDLTTQELEALYYFIAVYGVLRVPPSLRTAALTGHEKIERACTAALERHPGGDNSLTPAEPQARTGCTISAQPLSDI